MTNKEVINFLNQVRKILLDDKSWLESTIQPINEAFDMAISALEAQDLQQTCNKLATDTISRQAAIDAWKADFKGYVDCLDLPRDDYNGIMEYIDEAPSAQPEIILCKDCKFAEVADKEDGQDGYTCQFHRGSIWFSGSYCSWAERR